MHGRETPCALLVNSRAAVSKHHHSHITTLAKLSEVNRTTFPRLLCRMGAYTPIRSFLGGFNAKRSIRRGEDQ